MGNSVIQTEPFVLNQITTDAIHSFVKRNDNSLKVRISQKIHSSVQTRKVQSIINNLLDNSNKNSQNNIIHLHLRIFSGYLYIKVKDFGNGFDINKIGKFIQPFNQGAERDTKQGLGLGLTIIKSHIDLLKGSFKARSTIGEGTIFFVKIPVLIVHSKDRL
ncbi:ATP-binding protein [Serratia symbiotica]|uniref:sensor histidine kinase n=1 Tax=Serratia symbiotica TaxID=138074 RepID=UPI001B36CC49|nr:ATP-binding protein [Serratia symbiotica]